MSDGNLSKLVIGLILVSMVIIGVVEFTGHLANTYGVSDANNTAYLQASASKANESTRIVAGITERIEQQQETDEDLFGFALGLASGAISAITLPLSAAQLTVELITSVLLIFGIPPWVTAGLFALISAVLIFTVMSALLKWPI